MAHEVDDALNRKLTTSTDCGLERLISETMMTTAAI